jgi:hypothetical protein
LSDGPVSRLVGIAYVPKPTIVAWADGLARLQRTTLPADTIEFGQYHDKGADLVTPAVVCGVWKTHEGNHMVNVLTPYGYHRRKLADMMTLSLAELEKRWNSLTAQLNKPKAEVGWIVETRILALESVRSNPTLVRLETSAGRRIFGAMVSDNAARKILSSAIDPVEAYSVVADGQLAALKLDSAHRKSEIAAA